MVRVQSLDRVYFFKVLVLAKSPGKPTAVFASPVRLCEPQLHIGEPGSNATLQFSVNYAFPFISICRSTAKRQLGLAAAQRRGPRVAPPLQENSLASEAARYRLRELWFPTHFQLQIGREAAIRACCRVAASAAQRLRPPSAPPLQATLLAIVAA